MIGRLRRNRTPRQVTLYGKPGCHLCEDARALLDRLGRRYPIELEEIDITTDPSLFRRYDIRIPVIVVDGQPELEAPIDKARLKRALKR
jgi:glutaredoxin